MSDLLTKDWTMGTSPLSSLTSLPHLSPLPFHLSPLTSHLSPFTSHPSPLTSPHPSPPTSPLNFTSHLSPMTSPSSHLSPLIFARLNLVYLPDPPESEGVREVRDEG